MGICAHKKDQESSDLPSIPLPPGPPAKRLITQQFLDMRKAHKVPLLSLAHNPLYLKRIEAMKSVSSLKDETYPLQTQEDHCGPVERP